MIIRVHSVTTKGLQPVAIDIEVQSTSGIPQVIIIGLVSTAVREAKDRIITALKQLGIRLKARRTIISLTPADIKKTGSSFDLAIAVGVLSLYQKVAIDLNNSAFIGEVSLDGSILPVSTCLIQVIAAQKLGYSTVYVPHDNLSSVVLVEGITIYGIKKLSDLLESNFKKPTTPDLITSPSTLSATQQPRNIVGQYETLRALTIAIAGHHHLHLVGPPGVGKTTIPKVAKFLTPQLSKQQALELQAIYSLTKHYTQSRDIYAAPFRTVPHSITLTQLIGSAHTSAPGEISLAHNGILQLDELPNFSLSVLSNLKSILGTVNDATLNSKDLTDLPRNCLIIATSNPCPCGYWQTGIRKCRCSTGERIRYLKKLSGPLLDRFDIHLTVLPLTSAEYAEPNNTIDLEQTHQTVKAVRGKQLIRYNNTNFYNSNLGLADISHFCTMTAGAHSLLEKAVGTLRLSTRSYQKTVSLAQTIADLESARTISEEHIAEALSYRFEQVWTSE